MGTLDMRTSSTTAGGTANATSLGGRPSASAPSATKHAFWDTVTMGQSDSGHTDYRCVFIYNNTGNTWNNVMVAVQNKGGGATVTVALSSTATNTFASYNTAVIGSETTAPSISGSYATSVNIGTLTNGQVKAVWLKRVTPANVAKTSNDTATIVATGTEVLVVSA